MANFNFDAVIKIGSMALIRKEDNDLDYNIFARLASELKPVYILVSSGATEIGRNDYMKRHGGIELKGNIDEIKTDYSALGLTILMSLYRDFISPEFSVRQVLVEHSHFNDPAKAEHIKKLLFRSANQNAIPIVNYNDAVSDAENMRMELADLKSSNQAIVECVDNDETAAVIASLVGARLLVILSSVEGIYMDAGDPSTLVETIDGADFAEVSAKIDALMESCNGTSRYGSAGAAAKLKYARQALGSGTTVIIAHARHRLKDIISGKVKRTIIRINQ